MKVKAPPLEKHGWFPSQLVMAPAEVTATQLLSRRLFICLSEHE